MGLEETTQRLRDFGIATVAGHYDIDVMSLERAPASYDIKGRCRDSLRGNLQRLIPTTDLTAKYTWREAAVDEKGEEQDPYSTKRFHARYHRIFLAIELSVRETSAHA